MEFSVLFFAQAKQIVGANSIRLPVCGNETVGELKVSLCQKFPEMADLVARSSFAVNQQYAQDETAIDDGAEVALIPPVSGG
jgi:molybdopterin converting factor subunit 1